MHKLILILLAALASLVIGTTGSDSSLLIHTDDTELFGKINIKGLLDFTNSEESKASSHDGEGINVQGVYFHSAPESAANNQTAIQATPTSGMVKKRRSRGVSPTVALPVTQPITTCYPSVCESDSGVTYSDNAHLSSYFSQTCQWIQANIGNDWETWKAAVSVWFNNVECQDLAGLYVSCSFWIGITVAQPADLQDDASMLLVSCPDNLVTTMNSCQGLKQGGFTLCGVPSPVTGGIDGTFSYWYRGFLGPSWGLPCDGHGQFSSLKCGHMTCHSGGRCG